jgi:hypothetical protein
MIDPRRSSGAVVISQVRAPDQIRAPAIPWMNLAASSRRIWSPKPNTRLARPSRIRPLITVFRGPTRLATKPAGSDPSRVPAA